MFVTERKYLESQTDRSVTTNQCHVLQGENRTTVMTLELWLQKNYLGAGFKLKSTVAAKRQASRNPEEGLANAYLFFLLLLCRLLLLFHLILLLRLLLRGGISRRDMSSARYL